MNTAKDHIVAVDTMILVWGIRRDGSEEQVKQAGWLFKELDDNDTQVLVPSIALAEYLTPCDPATHSDVIAPLAKRFIIAPFDVKCAALAARLFLEGKQDRQMGVENARNLLKSDSLIVATAAVHGARTFYSEDADCRTLAERARLKAEALPTIAPDLFSQ